jgi:hypothetical protein
LAPAWNPHGQVGQRVDAVRTQCRHGSRRQPTADVVANVGLGRPRVPKNLYRLSHGFRVRAALGDRMREQGREVVAMHPTGDGDQPTSDAAEDPASRLPCPKLRRQVTHYGFAYR